VYQIKITIGHYYVLCDFFLRDCSLWLYVCACACACLCMCVSVCACVHAYTYCWRQIIEVCRN
jgi:hypothetical protein